MIGKKAVSWFVECRMQCSFQRSWRRPSFLIRTIVEGFKTSQSITRYPIVGGGALHYAEKSAGFWFDRLLQSC